MAGFQHTLKQLVDFIRFAGHVHLFKGDCVFLAQNHRALDDISQLPDIPGPVVRTQVAGDIIVEARNFFFQNLIVKPEKVIGNRQNVFPPLAQRREKDRVHLDA